MSHVLQIRRCAKSRSLAVFQKFKKREILRSLAGIHDPTFNNGDRHYCASPETDLKKKESKTTGNESTVTTATPVKCSKVIHY
jgi:hypothetical protein